MKLIISYQATKFQIPPLSESNFTEVGIRHPKKPLWRHCDVTSQYLVFKISPFVELNRSYEPSKFYWPRFSGSNFTRAGGKHPPDLHALKKNSPYASVNPPPRATPGVLHSTAAPGPGFIFDDLPRGPGFCHKITFSTVKKYTFTQLTFGSYLHALHRQFRLWSRVFYYSIYW